MLQREEGIEGGGEERWPEETTRRSVSVLGRNRMKNSIHSYIKATCDPKMEALNESCPP